MKRYFATCRGVEIGQIGSSDQRAAQTISRWSTIAVSLVAALLIIVAPLKAQDTIAGTWRVEGTGTGFPWSVVLRVNGSELQGLVSSCTSNRSVPISEGQVAGSAVTFKCINPPRTRTLTFTGTLVENKLSLDWKKETQPGEPTTSPDEAIFGDKAPQHFTAKRVLNAEAQPLERSLISEIDQVRGAEFHMGVNLPQKNLKIMGRLFLPQKVNRADAVVVVIQWGLGAPLFGDTQLRNLAQTSGLALLLAWINPISDDQAPNADAAVGADALVLLLQRLAQDSGHPEVATAPLMFWAHSAAGPFGPSFAGVLPERTIAFVRYHSGPLLGADLKVVAQIPALFFCGGKDTTVDANGRGCSETGKGLWENGRALGAPWTYALEPEATHGNPADLPIADELLIPWMSAVLRQRLPSNPGLTLRMVNGLEGAQSTPEAGWLPDEATRRGWQTVTKQPR